ncbi:MAG: maleylpyruvate isomerase family mycothiol-dependent enzyme [Nocardioides sp.]
MTSGTATGLDPLALFAAEADRLAKRIPSLDLAAPVPACATWTAYDLLVHLGNVHAWAATIVETGRAAATHNDEPSSRRARTVADWYAAKAEDLYEVLRTTDPAQPCWNFAFGQGEVGFWRRRQLHEVTVHAYDVEAAGGAPQVPASDVATDGVDEVLTVMLARMHARGHPVDLVAPLSVVCSDTGRAWALTPRRGADGPPYVADRRQPASDELSGPAAALYLALWKRAPADLLTRTGDRARIEAFLASRLVP